MDIKKPSNAVRMTALLNLIAALVNLVAQLIKR